MRGQPGISTHGERAPPPVPRPSLQKGARLSPSLLLTAIGNYLRVRGGTSRLVSTDSAKKILPASHRGGCDHLFEEELTLVHSRPPARATEILGCLLESGKALTDVLPCSAWVSPAALRWAPADLSSGTGAGARRPLRTLRPQVQCLKESGFSTPGKPAPSCCL